MRVSAILAAASNGVIGVDGQLPWRLKTDVERFRRLTTGHHVIMGRRTWEEIGSRPLPGRICLVLSRREGFAAPGGAVLASLDDAIATAREAGETDLFVIGGAGLFQAAFRIADRVCLTRVLEVVDGDRSVDLSPLDSWRAAEVEEVPAGPRDDHATRFEILVPPCRR